MHSTLTSSQNETCTQNDTIYAIPATFVSCKSIDLSESVKKMLRVHEPVQTRSTKYSNIDINDDIPCMDTHKDCLTWALENECVINPSFMEINCAKSCNTCHLQTQTFRSKHCKNDWYQEEDCIRWATEGECIANPAFMREQCSKACNYCDYSVRCEPYKYYPSALNLSDVPYPQLYDKVFYKIMGDKYLRWKYDIKMLSFDPPIIEFNNLIPDYFIDDFLIKNNFDYKASADAGELDENFVYKPVFSETRTSSNAWCGEHCIGVEYIYDIIEEITNIKRNHYEQIQVLKYEIGEHYYSHHDFIDIQYDMPCGPRILTLFIYLNDNNLIGGETGFERLNLKIKPKKGSGILWPNVLSNDPYNKIDLTHHAGLDVLNGTKHAMNVWIHLHDFVRAHKYGCTG